MDTRTELDALLNSLAGGPPDATALRVLSDWFEERITPKPTIGGDPTGWASWWSSLGLSQRFIRYRHSRGKWAGWEIESFLRNGLGSSGYFPNPGPSCISFDHCGTAVVEGRKVYVSEPYGYDDDRAVADCLATRSALNTVVTFARQAAHNANCYRFIIWHTHPVAPEYRTPDL